MLMLRGGKDNKITTIQFERQVNMKILTEATPTSPKFMVYSLPGMGKTSLASKMKKSLIIDIEGGANYINTPRTEQVTSLDSFYEIMVELWKSPVREYDYIVIDTVDWLVRLIVEKVAGINKQHLDETLNRSNGGYGNGKQILENHVRTRLLPMLVEMSKKGYGICLLAHADKKDMMDSDGTMLEQITPKIDPNTLNAFVEWCDAIFYLKKDMAGNRILQLDSDGTALAKNRTGMTGELSLNDVDINEILKADEVLRKEKAK